MNNELQWIEDDDFPGDFSARHKHRTFALSRVLNVSRSSDKPNTKYRLIVWGAGGVGSQVLLDVPDLASIEDGQRIATQYVKDRSEQRARAKARKASRASLKSVEDHSLHANALP